MTDTIESLRQQVRELSELLDCAKSEREQQLTDAIEVANLSDGMYRSAIRQLAEWTRFFAEWESPGNVHEALISLQKDVNALNRQLAESQAREKVLRDALETLNTHFPGNEHHLECERVYALVTNALTLPSDSTALESAIRQAKREGYILGFQASGEGWNGECGGDVESEYFQNCMAEEIE